jgi:arsenate reductase
MGAIMDHGQSVTQAQTAHLPKTLASTVETAMSGFDGIPDDRKGRLAEIAAFVESRRAAGETASLTFICTHNSRRSHLSQIWAQTAASVYGVDGVTTFSGGTEATAFNPRAVAAVRRAGFMVEVPEGSGDNPLYRVRFNGDGEPMECFSKIFDAAPNPTEDFAAIMTCSDADNACPLVPGAATRIAIPYVDPKASDGTDAEAATYDERSLQIATEMLYAFSLVEV